MASLIHLILQVSLLVGVAYGYGFRYNYDPATQHSSFWTHVPGAEPITQWDSSDPNFVRGGRNWGGNWNPENWNNRGNYWNNRDNWGTRGNWNRAYNNWNPANYNNGDYWNRANWNRGDPNLNRYWDATAQSYKWTCKTDAYYSDTEKKCVWDPKVTPFNRNWSPDTWNRGDPNLNRYWDAKAQAYKWTCKTDAYYSDTEKQCVWDPNVTPFNRNWNRDNWNRGDPNLNRYWDATAQSYKWTCKTDAYYSDTEKQCVWDPKVTPFNRFV